MGPFKRLTRTLAVKVDVLLDNIENHEATTGAAIQELEEATIAVRARQKGCARRVEDFRGQLQELERDAGLWRERAVRSKGDEERALSCVRRMQRAMEQTTSTTERLVKEEELLATLTSEIAGIDEKLEELRQRQAVLAAREAHAGARNLGRAVEAGGVATMLDRWEARIDQGEARMPSSGVESDALSREFARQESEASAREALQQIWNEGGTV